MAYNPFRDDKQTQAGRVNPFRQTEALGDKSDRERVVRNWQSDAYEHGIVNAPQYSEEGKAYQQLAREYAKYGTQYQTQLSQGVTGRQWQTDAAQRLEELMKQQKAAQHSERHRQDVDAISDPGLWITTTEQYDALPEMRRQEEARKAKQRPAVSLADYDKRIAELRKEKEWADYFAEAGLRDEQGYTRGVISGRTAYDAAADKRRRIAELENRLVTLNQNAGWVATVEQSDMVQRETEEIQRELEELGAGYKRPEFADYAVSWRNGVRDNWTDEERSNFYYLFSGNEQEAQEYARRVNDRHSYAEAQRKKKELGEWASQNFWTGLAGTMASVATNMTSLADTLDRTKEYLASGDISVKSSLTPADAGMAMRQAIGAALNDKYGAINDNIWVIGGKGWGDLYQLGGSVIDSLASVYLLGGFGTYANFFGQASKTAYEEGIQRGLSVDKALTYGYASGVAEVAGEMFSIEHLIKMKNPSSLKGIIKNIFVQGGIEASEESATTLMNTISDAIINGDKSELASNYYALIQAGYTPEEAERLAIADWTGGIMYDALGGFVSGVASAGIQGTVQGARRYQGDAQEILDYAKSEGKDTAAGKKAQKYEARVQRGKGLTNYQAGTLTELTQKTITAKDMDNIQRAVGKRLTELGEDNARLTEAVTRQAVQLEARAKGVEVPRVTAEQRKLIANSKAARRVLSEMDINTMRLETAADDLGYNSSRFQRSNAWARDIGTRIIAPGEYGVRSTNTVTADEKRASVKVGDESGTVVGFKDGKARIEVETDGGKVIREASPEQVQELPKQTKSLFDEISRYDGETQAAMYAAYAPGQDIGAYVHAADAAINLYGAQTNATLEQARSFGKATFRVLSDAQLDALIEAGRKMAEQRRAKAEAERSKEESKAEARSKQQSYRQKQEADKRRAAADEAKAKRVAKARAELETKKNEAKHEEELALKEFNKASADFYKHDHDASEEARTKLWESFVDSVTNAEFVEGVKKGDAAYLEYSGGPYGRTRKITLPDGLTLYFAAESNSEKIEAGSFRLVDNSGKVIAGTDRFEGLHNIYDKVVARRKTYQDDLQAQIEEYNKTRDVLKAKMDDAKLRYKEAARHYAETVNALNTAILGAYEDANSIDLAEEVEANDAVEYGGIRPGKVSYDGGTLDGHELKPASKDAIERMSEAERSLADALAAAGINVVFYESEANAEGKYKGAQGAYRDGTVYLDVNAGMRSVKDGQRTIVLTAAHELTHFIRESSESSYIALREFITARLMQQGLSIEDLITQKRAREGRELSYDAAMEEVIADACEMMLTNPTAIKQLASDNMPLAKKIRKWLNDFFGKIKSAFAGLEAVHDDAKAMAEYMDELRAMWDSALAEAVRNRANKNAAENGDGAARYSLRPVAPVRPTSDTWQRSKSTAEAKRIFPDMWNVAADKSEKRNPTQIASTVGTYRNIFNILKGQGFDGTILDASSGLGIGTETGRKEFGFKVEDIEPFPGEGYNPMYRDYSALDKQYDAIISSAVLNVLPQDQRDALVSKMGQLLKPGGRMYITTRGKDVDTLAKSGKNIRLGDMEWIETVKGSYQKGFTNPELVAYLKDALGDGFDVVPASMATGGRFNNNTSVVVTKRENSAKYSIREDAPAEIHKAVTDKNYGGDIWLTDTTPSIMLGRRGVNNLPMLMKASHIRENILTKQEAATLGIDTSERIHYHGLGEELFKKVIDGLEDITVAYRGTPRASDPSRRENSFLLLSSVKDGSGNTIVVPVYINEMGNYNRVFMQTNKIASVYGRSAVSEYIKREVAKGNLVRIKKRSPVNSESPAPTAVDYNDVTSQAKAANKSAMAFGNNSIRSSPENSNTKIKKSEREIAQERGKRRAEIYSELQRLKDERSRLLEQDADYAAAQEKRRYATTFRERVDATRALNAAKAKIDTAELDERIQALQDERSAIDEAERAEYNAEKEKYSGAKTRGYAELPDTRTAELDEKYNDAVKRGNKKETQALVLEAAERAMPASVVRDEGGKLLPVYHWTNASFNSFDRSYARTGNEMDGFFFAPDAESTREYGDNAVRAYLNITNPAYDPYLDRTHEDSGTLLRERLAYEGYDGVIRTENGKIVEYMAFDPEQIKSAEPVVYDDNGKVIPLSERFNSKSRDVRYSNRDVDLTAKYPQLNLNEDISEFDGVPAIELTDGSVLPITERDGRYPTHVSFIEANRIDVDDLKSGGWIGNGVYDPSFTSDTQRYIERQQARKRVAELTGKQYEQFKYSMRDVTTGDTREELAQRRAAYARLERENAELRKRVEHFKRQTQKTQEATVRESDVARLARQLIRDYTSDASAAEVQRMLQKLGDYIVQGSSETLSYEEIRRNAESIADYVLDNAHAVIAEEDERLHDYREYLKSTPMRITDDTLNDLPEGFRKRWAGKLKLRSDGRGVDSVWMELQDSYGSMEFPSDIYAQSDMLEIMTSKFAEWSAMEGNPFYSYMGEAVFSLTNDIVDAMLGEDVRQTAPTYADKAEARLARERAKGAEAVARERERSMARAERLKEMIENEKSKRREAVAKEKAEKWAKVGAVRDYYQSLIKRQRAEREETAERGKCRARVERRVKELGDWMLANSDKQHIPEVFKKTIGEFLTSIDFTSRRSLEGGAATQKDARFQQRLSALQELLRKQAAALEENSDADTFTGYLDIDGDTMDALAQLVQDVNAAIGSDRTWTVNRMNAADLARLDQVLKVLQHSVKNMNKLLANAHFKSSIEAAQNTMTRMDALKTNRKYAGKVKDFFAWDNVTPIYAFRRFGEGGRAIFDGFTRGWDKMAFNMRTIYDFTENTYTPAEVKAWERDIREIKLSSGETVLMPVSAIMELYVSQRQEATKNHLNGGGLRVREFKDGAAKVNQTEHYLMTVEDVGKIIGELDARQRAVADALQRFAADIGAGWGNEVSMKRFGYRAFTEDNYWPIATDDNTRNAVDPQARANDMYRLLNMSMTKSRIAKANNALVVGSIFDTFAAHMADMAKYNALALPVLDAMKWYNYREKETLPTGQIKTSSVQKSIEGAYGAGARNYIVTLMKDINGTQESGRGEGFARKMISNYKVAAVAANLRVALLQPTSIVRATMVLDPKYLVKGTVMKGGMQEMLEHSGTAIWKEFGGYDTNIGRNIRDQIKQDATTGEKIKGKSMVLAELGDRMTWGALWNACKLEVMDKQHVTGDALMQATADRFREVIYLTQVMDSTLTRSHNMRSKSTYASLATAFMSEPTLSYSMVEDAFMDYLDERKISKSGTAAWQQARGKLVKAFGVYAMTAAASAIIESIADAWRDDDDYEGIIDKILEAMFGTKEGWFLDGNLLDDLRISTKLPIAKDIMSLMGGYSNDRMDIAWAQNFIKMVKVWRETIQLATGKLDKPTDITYNGKMTWYGKLYVTLKALSQMTGYPMANLTRDVSAIWNTTVGSWTGKKLRTYYPGVKNSVKYAYQDGYLSGDEARDILLNEGVCEDENEVYFLLEEWDSGKGGYSRYGSVKDAAKAGDKTAYKDALKELTEHGVTEKNAQSAIRSAIKEWYQGTEDTPQSVSKQEAIKKLQEFGGMTKKEAEAKALEWTCKIVEGIEYGDIKSAYLDGDVNATKAKQMLMRYGGLSSEEADKRVLNYRFEEQYGFTYSRSNVQAEFTRGSVNESMAKSMLMQYGGKTEEEAERSVQAFKFLRSYPEYDAEDITETQIAKYYESVEGSGITVKDYVNYSSFVRGTSADVDANGDAITGSKMRKVIEYIDGLNLTAQQKDVLFLTQYARSNLKKTPWH